MTVAATIRKAGPTPGNGLATVFPFAFKVFASTDIQAIRTVIATGAQSVLVLNDPLGYTVALNVDQNANPGGSITYNPLGVPLPATQQLTIVSVVPQAQGTHIINGGAFFANNIEDAVDKAVINTQDLAAKVASSIQFPAADSAALNAILPAAASRVNSYVAFDGAGNVIASPGPTSQPVSVAMLPVVQAATLALGRAALGFSAYFDSLIAAASATAIRLLLGFSAIAAKGDTFFGTAANTIATKTAPVNGYVRAADSVQADGWQDVPITFNWKNRLINPSGRTYQRAIAATADDTYFADRWNMLTQTGTVAPSVLSDPEDGFPKGVRITQSQAAAQRFGFSQIIEGANCKDLRGQSGVLVPRVRISNSQAIRYAILGWTSTEDTVTSDVVNDWTSGAYTAGNFFLAANVSVLAVGAQTPAANTWTSLAALTVALGSAFNNIIVMVWTEGTAAQNVTLDFDYVQFERGSVATEFERRNITEEEGRCFRYRESVATVLVTNIVSSFPTFVWTVAKRASPTLTLTPGSGVGGAITTFAGAASVKGGYQTTNHSVDDGGCLITGDCEL